MSLKIYMFVNIKTHKISSNTHKLAQIFILINKKLNRNTLKLLGT